MQRNIVETVMGGAVLLVAGGFLFFFYQAADIRPSTGYELTANFSKIDGLQAGSDVRVSGVKIGKVTSFDLDRENYQAVVRMNIDPAVKLPRDTAAVIASAGLLDGKFMTLEPGADEEMLEAGDKIEYTQSTPSLEQLLGQVIFSLNNDKGKGGSSSETAKSAVPDVPDATETP